MNAETVDTADDPFERAVRREGMLRRAVFSRTDAVRLVKLWVAAVLAAWAVVLVGHWLVFPEPRWLVVLHTVLFALGSTLMAITMVIQSQVARRLLPPDPFED